MKELINQEPIFSIFTPLEIKRILSKKEYEKRMIPNNLR
jgi:hypothetical protein